jgi:hypothetical protein
VKPDFACEISPKHLHCRRVVWCSSKKGPHSPYIAALKIEPYFAKNFVIIRLGLELSDVEPRPAGCSPVGSHSFVGVDVESSNRLINGLFLWALFEKEPVVSWLLGPTSTPVKVSLPTGAKRGHRFWETRVVQIYGGSERPSFKFASARSISLCVDAQARGSAPGVKLTVRSRFSLHNI